jgi:hypothetical protein
VERTRNLRFFITKAKIRVPADEIIKEKKQEKEVPADEIIKENFLLLRYQKLLHRLFLNFDAGRNFL